MLERRVFAQRWRHEDPSVAVDIVIICEADDETLQAADLRIE